MTWGIVRRSPLVESRFSHGRKGKSKHGGGYSVLKSYIERSGDRVQFGALSKLVGTVSQESYAKPRSA
jgi:hypothetical protein